MESIKLDKEEYLSLLWKVLSIKLKRGGSTPHKEVISTKSKFKELSRKIASHRGGAN